jgi:hypothetical protein
MFLRCQMANGPAERVPRLGAPAGIVEGDTLETAHKLAPGEMQLCNQWMDHSCPHSI